MTLLLLFHEHHKNPVSAAEYVFTLDTVSDRLYKDAFINQTRATYGTVRSGRRVEYKPETTP